ncbi:DUF1223 domain-containing protein [Massilia aerilata]|uniref:DUF1223 domain-containing protein n=1 Tax=Massilia aerilata TaxID=453817 RepID=A0ABW0RT80_9BURK
MHDQPLPPLLFAFALALAAPASYAAAACQVNSGAATAALVELYTSEGCSSCPPADRRLAALRSRMDAGAAVVPLTLHVGYWDSLGWKDPFAQPLFDQRQRLLLQHGRRQVAYTPQFFVNGTEVRDWDAALPEAIRRTNAQPAPLKIVLKGSAAGGGMLRLEASARAADPHTAGALYLVLTETGLVSKVARGENGGATLRHEDVARLWLGPFPLAGGAVQVQREVKLAPAWRRDRLQALAFVQDPGAGVLQAVDTAACKDGVAGAEAGRP